MPEADIDGPQRKVLRSAVRPVRTSHGASGIPVRGGRTLPFIVERGWNAPSGYYTETWYLFHPETKEVLIEGGGRIELIRGLPAITDVSDEMRTPYELLPGGYKIAFALDGLKGGEIDVVAVEVPAEEAA